MLRHAIFPFLFIFQLWGLSAFGADRYFILNQTIDTRSQVTPWNSAALITKDLVGDFVKFYGAYAATQQSEVLYFGALYSVALGIPSYLVQAEALAFLKVKAKQARLFHGLQSNRDSVSFFTISGRRRNQPWIAFLPEVEVSTFLMAVIPDDSTKEPFQVHQLPQISPHHEWRAVADPAELQFRFVVKAKRSNSDVEVLGKFTLTLDELANGQSPPTDWVDSIRNAKQVTIDLEVMDGPATHLFADFFSGEPAKQILSAKDSQHWKRKFGLTSGFGWIQGEFCGNLLR